MIFDTFKAKIHGTCVLSTLSAPPVNTVLTFTKYRIKVTNDQLGKLYLDPMGVQQITDNMRYTFDKLLNKDDKKMFSIIRIDRLNALDNGIEHLDINWWNKIKANIIHRRYWIHKNADWIFKSIVTTVIGALIALIADNRGFNEGYRKGLEEGKSRAQDTVQNK